MFQTDACRSKKGVFNKYQGIGGTEIQALWLVEGNLL